MPRSSIWPNSSDVAAVGAVELQEADPAGAVAEHHEVLVQDADGLGQVLQLL